MMGWVNSKLFCIWKGFDSAKFNGLKDEDIFRAYKIYFNEVLIPYRPQSLVLCGGTENLFTSINKEVIFVGPKAIEIVEVLRRNQSKTTKKKYVAIVHPVLKSQEFHDLTKSKAVRQVFLQVLIPGHTCFLLFQDGLARLLDNKMTDFGWNPDMISHIRAVIPWKDVLPQDSTKMLHLYTFSFDTPIQKSCSLIVMACIKHLIQNNHWGNACRKLGIVRVMRTSGKSLTCEKITDNRVNNYYCNMVMQCFLGLAKAGVIRKDHF